MQHDRDVGAVRPHTGYTNKHHHPSSGSRAPGPEAKVSLGDLVESVWEPDNDQCGSGRIIQCQALQAYDIILYLLCGLQPRAI